MASKQSPSALCLLCDIYVLKYIYINIYFNDLETPDRPVTMTTARAALPISNIVIRDKSQAEQAPGHERNVKSRCREVRDDKTCRRVTLRRSRAMTGDASARRTSALMD